jgi:hypothetical protein
MDIRKWISARAARLAANKKLTAMAQNRKADSFTQ